MLSHNSMKPMTDLQHVKSRILTETEGQLFRVFFFDISTWVFTVEEMNKIQLHTTGSKLHFDV